jgi:hypothetical protein
VSLRTIQRLERLHSCSGETLMALAAALGVDARELPCPPLSESAGAAESLWPRLTSTRGASAGALLGLPIVLFVAVNLLKYGAGIAAPYDLLASAGRHLGLVGLFDLVSPVVFIGGALIAIFLSLAAQVRARVERHGRTVVLSGVGVEFHVWSTAVMLLTLAAFMAMLVYAIGENLPDFLRAILA